MYKSYCEISLFYKKHGMLQLVRAGKCVFKIAVSSSNEWWTE